MNTDNITVSQSENPVCRLFEKDGLAIQVAVIEGALWFMAQGICEALGYKNTSKTINDHCDTKGVTFRYTHTNGGDQKVIFINEPNLYRLVIKSRKSEACVFEKWVFEEVLPSIRQNGGYIFGRTEEEIVENATKSALWAKERLDAKRKYTVMTDAIKLNAEREGRIAATEEYAREADMLNMIIIGMKSATWRRKLDLEKNELIRDSMEDARLAQYSELEQFNASLIKANMPFEMRRGTLTTFFDNTKQLRK